ncbi:hypothetical protein [Emticicia sp. C21]|uniref:hypothetical protein n=1 Tax=Emticicia sp. C21 TaxID=2302915 RepID=UPI000E34CB38|nr:hypothetical protein [Emticicia sp. C21]RFS16437.1 hypothetical protein D0T08_12185 [Emticicia sp. C21]
MKKLIATILCCCAFAQVGFSQHICSAAFLGNKMIVNQYTDKCYKNELPLNATGELSVSTVYLDKNESKAVDRIPFKIAIKEQGTKTITMFSREDFMKVDVQKVLSQCKKGDQIVLLTLDKQYFLPHNEILVK